MSSIIDKVKKYNINLIIVGIAAISAGGVTDNAMPWIDQFNLFEIEMCIADIHFRNHTETQFQECVSPDIKKIENIQKISALTTILYSMGGICIGFGFKKQ